VDFGGKAAARATERLGLLPPFAPAAETWARTIVESTICTRCAVPLRAAKTASIASNTPLAHPPKPFPDAVPWPNSVGNARQVML
jgi:hypothetical protein